MLASASAVVTVSCLALLLHLQMGCFSIGNCYCFLLSTFFCLVFILAFVLMNSTDIVPCGCFQCLARTPISKFLSHTCPWIQSQFKINLVSSPFQYCCS
jgi:hypothetical protein